MILSSRARFCLIFFATLPLSYLVFLLLESRVDWGSSIQDRYIIDGFYYRQFVVSLSELTLSGLANINPSSTGILFINWLYSLLFNFLTYPIINYLILFFIFIRYYTVNSPIFLFLLLSTLYPYLNVVSKELVVLVGCLLLFSYSSVTVRALGVLLVFLGRPETGLILVATFVGFRLLGLKSSAIKIAVTVSLVLIYFLILKEYIYGLSARIQTGGSDSNYSCITPIFETCVSTYETYEFVLLNRVIAGLVLFIPKSFFALLTDLNVFNFNNATFSILLLSAPLILFNGFTFDARMRLVFFFCIANVVAYFSVAFLAPSRPFHFYFLILLILATLKPKAPSSGLRCKNHSVY